MTAKKRNTGDEIIAGMQEAIQYMQGKKTKARVNKVMIPEHIDVKAVRKKLHLTRQDFADRYGFSIRTLQHWEQGNRQPQGPARVLLFLLECEPFLIERILRKQKPI